MMQLDKDTYLALINAITVSAEFCSDFTIKNGYVRQLSDDRIILLEINVGLNDLYFRLANAKQKLKMFSLFKDSETISFEIEGNQLTFGDDVTKISFIQPAEDIMFSTYIDTDELHEMINVSEDDLVTTIQLDENLLGRIRTITDVLNTRQVIFKHDKLFITSDDKAQKATITSIDNLNADLVTVKDCFTVYDDVTISIYNKSNSYYGVFRGSSNDLDVNMYVRLNIYES